MHDRLILALDTSFGPVSAAVADEGGAILASFNADNAPGTQAETLPPRVAEMFDRAGLAFERLRRIAVTVGPGAFTGVRVGLAFAKGLRLATGAEVFGFTTLECLAQQAALPDRAVVSAIDAKRDEVYLQVFDRRLAPLMEPALLTVFDASRIAAKLLQEPPVLTGSGAPLLLDAIVNATVTKVDRIDTKLLARRAIKADAAQQPPRAAYLRAPDARLPA